MKKLAGILAIGLWAVVIMQACQIQYADEQKFDTLTLEQELKLDAERLAQVDSIASQIVLDTLQNIQQAQDIDLGIINLR